MQHVTLPQALEVLRRGDLLIYPTETLYGLGADISQPAALQKIYALKGRGESKLLSVLVPEVASIQKLVKELSDISLFLINNYLPGPLTLVLPAASHLPVEIAGEQGWVGIRLSSHPLATQLVKTFGAPITTTSANPAGRESGRSLSQLEEYFGQAEGVFFLPGGDLPASPGSTVIQVAGGRLKLLREGAIKFTEIEVKLRHSNLKFEKTTQFP